MVYSLLTKGQRPKTEGPIQKQKPATGCSSGLVEIVLRRLVQLVSAGNRFNGPPPMWWWCQNQAWPWTLFPNIVMRLYWTKHRVVKFTPIQDTTGL